MALMFTLMLTTLMLLLTTAFLRTNLDQIRMQGQGESGDKAQQAAISGMEYARMRLEADPHWGVPLSDTDRNFSLPGMRIFEKDDLGGAQKSFACVGVLGGGESFFQINFRQCGEVLGPLANGRASLASIRSNPDGPWSNWSLESLPVNAVSLNYLASGTYSPTLLPPLSPQRSLPNRSCLLQIIGAAKTGTRIVEVTLSGEKPTESSFLAGGNLAVDSQGTWWVESVQSGKNKVEAGGSIVVAGSPTLTKVKFNGGGTAGSSGAIQASSAGVASVLDPGDGHLNISHLDAPANLLGAANAPSGGTFRANAGVNSPPDLTPSSVEAQLTSASYATRPMPGGTYTFVGPDRISINGGAPQTGQLRSGSTTVAKIQDYKLMFLEGARLDFSGPTRINALAGEKPSVLLGYDSGGWLPWDSEGTFLKVNNGDLTIDGSLAGKGSAMSTGNSTNQGSVYVHGKSQLSSDPDAAVTLFAEKNIRVKPTNPSDADFFPVDLAAISQAMDAHAPTGAGWNSGPTPLNEFSNLNAGEQDVHTQGGATPVSDADVSASSIKTAPVTANLPELKVELGSQFPVLLTDPQAQVEYDRLFDTFTNTGSPAVTTVGMTAGRYIRMREFLREMQRSHDAGLPLPTSDPADPLLSPWADVTRNNELVNNQLRSEISYLDRQHHAFGFSSLRNLIKAPTSQSPSANPMTSSVNLRDTRWTGMMYARGSISVDTGGGKLDVRGSLVARNEVAVTNVTDVKTVYDPAYLQGLSQLIVGNGRGLKLAPYVYRVR